MSKKFEDQLREYDDGEVMSMMYEDVYAVRAEGERREKLALKKFFAAQKKLEKIQRELESAQRIIRATHQYC